jgi:TIR domain
VIGCFISYRRDDSAPWAGRLHDRLAASLDTWRIFFDIDSVDLGQDFRTVIASTLESCDVVLVLIGPTWLTKDEAGRRRIDDESDVHRIEVTTALNLGLRVIPILVGGAAMPRSSELPGDLQSLAFRNALTVDHGSFTRDVEVLERALRRIEPREPSGARAPVEPTATPSAPVAPGESDLRPVAAAPQTPTPAPVHSPSPTAAVVVPVVTVAAAPPHEATRGAKPDDVSSRAPTPPDPPQDTSSARGGRLAVIVALAAVVLIGIVVVATRRGGDSPTTTATGTTTSIDPGTPDSGALTPGPAATTVPEVQTSVVLPADTDIFQQPVDVAGERLQSAGLAVSQATNGCSNSTEPGFVRRVTLGSDFQAHILYGKSGDEIDDAAVLALRPGDEVTVWTPSTNPC